MTGAGGEIDGGGEAGIGRIGGAGRGAGACATRLSVKPRTRKRIPVTVFRLPSASNATGITFSVCTSTGQNRVVTSLNILTQEGTCSRHDCFE